MTSCVQYSARPGVDGIPPIVRGSRPSAEWFNVTNTSDEDGLKVTVAEGRIACPDLTGYSTATPTIAKFMRTLTVAELELVVTVTCGVYCKLTVEELTDSTNRDYEDEDAAGIIGVTVKMRNKIWRVTAGEIILSTTAPTDTSSLAHVLLADITVVDGVMSIQSRHSGLIFAPSLTVAYGEDPVVTSETKTYSVCDNGVVGSATFIAVT